MIFKILILTMLITFFMSFAIITNVKINFEGIIEVNEEEVFKALENVTIEDVLMYQLLNNSYLSNILSIFTISLIPFVNLYILYKLSKSYRNIKFEYKMLLEEYLEQYDENEDNEDVN